MSGEPTFHTYGNWRRPRETGLLGATFGTSIAAIAAAATVIIAGLFFGLRVSLLLAIPVIVCFIPLVISRDGRSGYERALMRLQFWRGRRRGEHTYASGTFSRVPGRTYRLPGVLADTELYEGIDSDGRTFGMIHMPSRGAYTVVFDAYPQGAEAVDQDVIDHYVGNWAQFLSAAGETSDILAVVTTVETLPETGIELYETVHQNTRADAPQLARDAAYQLATGLTTGGIRLAARIAITFEAQTTERRQDPSEQAVELGRRLPGLTAAAARSGVPCSPMDADEIMAFVRRSYDPASLVDVETGLHSGDGTGLTWEDCGPRTAHESPDGGKYVHDGAVSVTWEMREAPKGAVTERVLARLLAPNEAVPLKRVSVLYRPHSAGDATDIADRDYRNAMAEAHGGSLKNGSIASAKSQIEVAATSQARMEQARGAGMVRFGVLITVTEPAGSADVPKIDALIEDLSRQSRLTIRRSWCWQAAAFAACLGVGVIAPDHTTIPSFLSN
ncbi:SCO6880 family protein [Rhodococcus aetherivorans]|uniref:SCO6880 family protein n=1 Tax=Rhodococcus aetherivorans TaxID=191292 RepID=UPI00045CE204|nr:SCO6880 family protein [Rhodococcus aetherivorans]KDE10047.1 membrane protein [Rhodococcus aetherivorans]